MDIIDASPRGEVIAFILSSWVLTGFISLISKRFNLRPKTISLIIIWSLTLVIALIDSLVSSEVQVELASKFLAISWLATQIYNATTIKEKNTDS